jgi:hypothetical protein
VLLEDWQGRTRIGLARGFTARGGLCLADLESGNETFWQPDEVRHLRRAVGTPTLGEPA